MADAIGTDETVEIQGQSRHHARITRGLQYFYGLVALTFVTLALLHVPHPTPWLWVPYAAGAVLAVLTLAPSLPLAVSRLLAVSATALMFFFFSGFFMEVPRLESDWYQSQEGWSAVGLLVAAFTLLPVLSNFSCRCKARCRDSIGPTRRLRHPGFFTAPDSAKPRGS